MKGKFEMKRIALVLCATVSLLSGVNAMDLIQKEPEIQQQIPAKKFVVNTVPPVEVIQIPSEQRICFDVDYIDSYIDIEEGSYNGVTLNAPIRLSYDMTKEQIISALLASFGADKEVVVEEASIIGD